MLSFIRVIVRSNKSLERQRPLNAAMSITNKKVERKSNLNQHEKFSIQQLPIIFPLESVQLKMKNTRRNTQKETSSIDPKLNKRAEITDSITAASQTSVFKGFMVMSTTFYRSVELSSTEKLLLSVECFNEKLTLQALIEVLRYSRRKTRFFRLTAA